MRIVLFTPAVQTSAIGRVSCLITHKLIAQAHQVTIVRTEYETPLDISTHDFGIPLITWDQTEEVLNAIAQADTLIYQIGNNKPFHHGCLEWLQRFPGIVCLHDFFLGSLFNEWAKQCPEQVNNILHAWYGNAIAQHFLNASTAKTFIEEMANIAPLTEWICSMATGVVTHSHWGIERVLKSCPGPVYTAPLPYDDMQVKPNQSSANTIDTTSLQLLTIGHINANKRVASVIRAIARSSTLRKHIHYHLVGQITPQVKQELEQLAQNLQVHLTISGEVDSCHLVQALNDADVVSCLRWPALEGASASAIEAMLYAKAMIVTDTGFYRELPDFCVKKIDPNKEISGIKNALLHFYHHPENRRSIGKAAQVWASATFTADNYVQQLINIINATYRTNPIINSSLYFSRILKSWEASTAVIELEDTLLPLELFQLALNRH